MRMNQLCHTAQKLLKRQLTGTAIARGEYRYAVRLNETHKFLNKLEEDDLACLKKYLTYSFDQVNLDVRSVVIGLKRPVSIAGRMILALRLKGIYPRVSKENKVEAYTMGNGYAGRVIEVSEGARLSARMSQGMSEVSPRGTMSLERLTREVEVALKLGPETTDLLLGFGHFEELRYNGQEVGFVVYGIERQEDIRLITGWKGRIAKTGLLPKANHLAVHTGQLLRSMHDRSLAHRYPHLGNYAALNNMEARLLDLDTAIDLGQTAEVARPAILYLDLARTINDYQKVFDFKHPRYRSMDREVRLTPLLPHFLWGYFKGDRSLSFVSDLAELIDKPEYELVAHFGELPRFSEGWRWGGSFTLVEPTIRLIARPEQELKQRGWLDLAGFTENPLFGSFYQALTAVAATI